MDHHEGCHCDELGGEKRYDHARNVEPLLRVAGFVSFRFRIAIVKGDELGACK